MFFYLLNSFIFAKRVKIIKKDMRYYRNVFDLGDLNIALQEAFEIKQDRYKYESLGKHKTCLLIFFNNSLRTRLPVSGSRIPPMPIAAIPDDT